MTFEIGELFEHHELFEHQTSIIGRIGNTCTGPTTLDITCELDRDFHRFGRDRPHCLR